MATQSTPPARPASTPPTTTRRTRATDHRRRPCQRDTHDRPFAEVSDEEAFVRYRKTVGRSGEDYYTGPRRGYRPEGSHAVSRESLMTRLLHFAFEARTRSRGTHSFRLPRSRDLQEGGRRRGKQGGRHGSGAGRRPDHIAAR